MYILTGFRYYELYNQSGQYVKTVYSPQEAADAKLLYGYTSKLVLVDSIPAFSRKK